MTGISYGKHRGMTVEEIEKIDSSYNDWLLNLDNLEPDIREAITEMRLAKRNRPTVITVARRFLEFLKDNHLKFTAIIGDSITIKDSSGEEYTVTLHR